MGKVSGTWDPMLCIAHVGEGKYVSGGSTGAVYLWSGNSAKGLAAHKSKLQTVFVDSKKRIFTGGDDGSII